EEFPAEDLFLEEELMLDAKGFYQVPATGGQRSIGLCWPEKRILNTVTLEFQNPKAMPAPETVSMQYWSSKNREQDDIQGATGIFRSAWQGMWQALPGRIQAEGKRLVCHIAADQVPEFVYEKGETGTNKVRWTWPASGDSCAVRRPTAQSKSLSAVG